MSDAIARPPDGFTGFSIRHRYRWVEMDEPGYEGFKAEIRTNLTHDERRHLFLALAEHDQTAGEVYDTNNEQAGKLGTAIGDAKTPKERIAAIKAFQTFLAKQADTGIEYGRKRFLIVAPYIRAWNVYDDQFQEVPPPCVDAATAYDWIDATIASWLASQCQEAYKGGPKGKSLSPPSADAPAPPPEPTTDDDAD